MSDAAGSVIRSCAAAERERCAACHMRPIDVLLSSSWVRLQIYGLAGTWPGDNIARMMTTIVITRLPSYLRPTISKFAWIYLRVVTSGHVTKMAVTSFDPP